MPWEKIWSFLFPPDRKTSPTSIVTIVAFWIFAGWSFGILPAWGSGFAYAIDVKAITVSLLETSIRELRIHYCSAPKGTDAKRYFFNETRSKVRLYEETTGSDFHLPDCKDLVYATATTTG